MPQIDNPKVITPQDFPNEYKDLVAKLAELLNFTIEQMTNTINGALDYDNLAKKKKVVKVTVNSAGVPTKGGQFISDIRPVGITVLKASNLTSDSSFPTGGIHPTFRLLQGGIIEIRHLTGLVANHEYELTLELTP